MKISIPECEWAKHIVDISVDGASGYQWNGPASNKAGFIKGVVDLPPGSLVMAFRLKANAVKNKAALYAAIDGPRLYQLAITTGDANWSSILRPKAEEFLAYNIHKRAALVCHRLLTALGASTSLTTGVPNTDEDLRNESAQLMLLRRKYMVMGDQADLQNNSGALRRGGDLGAVLDDIPEPSRELYDPAMFTDPVPEFVRSSFRLWIGRMVRENSLSKEDVHRLIGASIDEMVSAAEDTRDDSPWRLATAERRISTK